MRTLCCGLLLLATTAWGAVEWAPNPPPVYKVLPDGSVEASDGGGSTPDHYLLTRASYRDFVFEFDVSRLADLGDKPRSLLTWAIDPQNPANRKCFFMDFVALKLGQKAHIRLVVVGGQAVVYWDDKAFSMNPTVYGSPPGEGRVGFLHYYNYGFRYEHLKLTSLDAKTLPAPTGLRGRLTPGGLLELSWTMADPYADLVTYRLYRASGTVPVTVSERDLVAETRGLSWTDPALHSNTSYSFVVAASFASGEVGPGSAPWRLRTGRLGPAAAPRHVTATERLDGTVRVRWQFAGDQRREGVALYRARTAAEAAAPGAECIAARLPVEADNFLAPRGVGRFFAVAALDPDGGTGPRTTVAAAGHAPVVQAGTPFPARHPYLLYDAAQIARARGLLAGSDWGRNQALALKRSAEGLISKPLAIPTAPSDEMSGPTSRLQTAGVAYQLLGDEKYAQWVREALLAYARLYPTLPVRGGRVRLAKTVSGLYEAVWFVPLLCAYDLVYESPAFTRQDHELIARDLIRPGADLFWVKNYDDSADSRPSDLHYRCYNFQAWFDSAVGLSGLLLKDADMVEYAIDGPYGFKHLLAHDVQDDGVFWERSLGYHSFVLSALFPLLQAARHCNLDLWQVAVPDDYNTDRVPLANYCVGDGDNGPKSLRLMLDAPFYFTFPDLTWPVVADSSRGPLAVQSWYRAGWERFRDPRYAWLLNRFARPETTASYGGIKDLAGQVRLAYDDKFLYLAARIADQVVRNSHREPGEVWAGDALWVGLKWSGAKTSTYDFIYGLSPGDGVGVPPVAALFNRFGAAAGVVSQAQLAVERRQDGYNLEAAIPLSEFVPQAGEAGTPLTLGEGQHLTADFVLYDSDQTSGDTTKEKMLGWACQTDRYDPTQGGTLFVGPTAPEGEKTINAPRAAGLTVDGKLGDWESLPARQARLGEKSAVMTDAVGGPSLEDLFYEPPPAEVGSFDLKGEKFANNGVLEAGCSLFPSTGFALLRDRLGADGLAPRETTCVNLTYGPYGGGHGHPDKLSLVLYANGQHLVPDFGSCGYDSPEKGTWTAQTISHNTVTVDQISQYPGVESQASWPCDSAAKQARGFLECFHGDPLLKAVQAWDESTYPGVKQRRTLALMGGVVFDFFQLTSAQKHTYDYTLHIAPPLKDAGLTLSPLADPLGARLGYQHLHEARGSEPTDKPLQTTWSDGVNGLRVTAAPVAGTRLLVARGLTTALDKLMPVQILRREGNSTVFAAVLEPLTATPAATTWTWSQTGNCLGASDGQGSFVAWSPEPTRGAQSGAVRFAGVLVAGRLGGAEAGASLVRGTLLQVGDLQLAASKPVSLHVSLVGGRPREITAGYDAGATVTVTWRGQPQRVELQPRQTARLSFN